MIVSFDVDGKPPKKSQWGGKNAGLVIKLRKAALEAREKCDFPEGYAGKVKVNLIVFAPNILEMNYTQTGDDDQRKFVGDLDSLIAGVCEYLQKGPKDGENNFELDKLFVENTEIGPDVPLIICDDSQIVEINARKEINDKLYYHVEVITI